MAILSITTIQQIVGKKLTKVQQANANSVIVALDRFGPGVGLYQPHRLAQYLAQLLHESGAFQYDREVWGPTKQQKKYDTGKLAKQLGNTPAADGDGFLFCGRTGIQITGRANTRAFRDWCRMRAADVPDFEKNPDAMLTDPWEGLGPIWYWDTRGLNRYADQGDIEMITKRINGGLNGYNDRLAWYARVALTLLGYSIGSSASALTAAVKAFQQEVGAKVDGDAGPRTRAEMHKALVARTSRALFSKDVQSAPVLDEREIEKPVVPAAVEEKVEEQTSWWQKITGLLSGSGAVGAWLYGLDWQTIAAVGVAGIVFLALIVLLRRQIIAAVKDIRAAVESK